MSIDCFQNLIAREIVHYFQSTESQQNHIKFKLQDLLGNFCFWKATQLKSHPIGLTKLIAEHVTVEWKIVFATDWNLDAMVH